MTDFTIFYTDDDEDDLSIFTDAVESLSKKIQLQTYSGGEKLLNAIYNPPPTPHVVFLDLNMPGKDGRETLKEIKEHPNYKKFHIIRFLTIYLIIKRVHQILS